MERLTRDLQGSASDASPAPLLRNYVAGSWVDSASERQLEVIDPASAETLAVVPLSTAAELEDAVAAARQGALAWRATPVIARSQRLFELRALLLSHRDELATLITMEMGKTLADAGAEIGRAVEMVECAAAAPTTMQGRVLEDAARGVDVETVRQPVGVCAAICPFNFPAMVPFWFLPFALATGNAFIVKPSEQVPLTQQRVFELLDRLDLPAGVVNLVNGDREVVDAMLDSPGIDAISFVGSAPVAQHVYRRAAASGKRVQALGGAKNHIVTMPDAVVEPTVAGVLSSAFGAAGQRCMASSVLVTVGDSYERIVPKLAAAAAEQVVGSGLDEQVTIGPLVSREARERVEGWVERAVTDGATLLLDGRLPDREGAFVGPTIVTDVTPEMPIVSNEVFGPVLAVIKVGTLAEAIDLIGASPYGNGASIFTESGAAVRRFRHDVQAGMLGVNIGVAAPVAFFPFSGWKGSFLGDLHAHGADAIDFYTRKKTVTSRFFSDGTATRLFGED